MALQGLVGAYGSDEDEEEEEEDNKLNSTVQTTPAPAPPPPKVVKKIQLPSAAELFASDTPSGAMDRPSSKIASQAASVLPQRVQESKKETNRPTRSSSATLVPPQVRRPNQKNVITEDIESWVSTANRTKGDKKRAREG